jgi:hypothetical protein
MDIEEKLSQARERAENYGALYGRKETAEDFVKTTYAMLYGESSGTVAERDSWVKRRPEYIEAIERKENCYAEWAAAQVYMKILFAEVEIFRTKSANDRYMDTAHR